METKRRPQLIDDDDDQYSSSRLKLYVRLHDIYAFCALLSVHSSCFVLIAVCNTLPTQLLLLQ
jgi:hypothetical protein